VTGAGAPGEAGARADSECAAGMSALLERHTLTLPLLSAPLGWLSVMLAKPGLHGLPATLLESWEQRARRRREQLHWRHGGNDVRNRVAPR
jgi:hypothetical protein